MCNAAGIEPIVTTSAESNTLGRAPSVKGPATCCDPEDMADLVESAPGNISLDPVTFLIHRLILWSRYCWGDPRNTTWGRQRAADGHPDAYRLKWIELGNVFRPPQCAFAKLRLTQTRRMCTTGAVQYAIRGASGGDGGARDQARDAANAALPLSAGTSFRLSFWIPLSAG